MRINPLTGRRTVYTPDRAGRRFDVPGRAPTPVPPAPRHDAACPFCPGNEAQLEEILAESPASGDAGSEAVWRTRVVGNRYPVVTPAGALDVESDGARGRHEVIIESPFHDRDLADMTEDELVAVIAAYGARVALLEGAGHEHVVLFRNRGLTGGASLVHPHAQIIATDFLPAAIARQEARARRHHEATGRVLALDMLADERRDGRRLVARAGRFHAFVPHAAEVPFELWILSEARQASFAELDGDGLADFARLLGDMLRRLRAGLPDPSYNFAIVGVSRSARPAPWAQWIFRLYPRLTRPGGFEIATGVAVNPSLPEADAATLRGAADGGAV
ncbi:MAG: galactose-1-phosphate uridylyltransferase [Alphaproteobacteria bacterium]